MIAGGSSADVVRGDRGNDRINGNSGNDRLFGNSGKDQITGSTGRDVVRAGAGNDRVDVRDGQRDRVNCARGRDTVIAVRAPLQTASQRCRDRRRFTQRPRRGAEARRASKRRLLSGRLSGKPPARSQDRS